MYYTYILNSLVQEGAIYIGYTKDLKLRIKQHNSPTSKFYTQRYAPWKVESYFGFKDETTAKNFEIYLKTNSGKAFLRKRLISNLFKEALMKFNNGRVEK